MLFDFDQSSTGRDMFCTLFTEWVVRRKRRGETGAIVLEVGQSQKIGRRMNESRTQTVSSLDIVFSGIKNHFFIMSMAYCGA